MDSEMDERPNADDVIAELENMSNDEVLDVIKECLDHGVFILDAWLRLTTPAGDTGEPGDDV